MKKRPSDEELREFRRNMDPESDMCIVPTAWMREVIDELLVRRDIKPRLKEKREWPSAG